MVVFQVGRTGGVKREVGARGEIVGARLWVDLDSAVWRGHAEVPSRWVMVGVRWGRGPTRSEQEWKSHVVDRPPSPPTPSLRLSSTLPLPYRPPARVSPPWSCSHSRWAFERRSDDDWVNGLRHGRALCLVPDRRCCAAEGKRVGGSEGRRDVEVEESIAPRKTPMRCSWCSPPAERGSGRKTSVGGRLLGPRLGPGTDAVVAVQRQPSERTAQSLLGLGARVLRPERGPSSDFDEDPHPSLAGDRRSGLGGPEKEGLGGSEGKVQTGLERGKISTSIIPSTHFSFVCPAPASRQGTRLETTVDHLQASTSLSHTDLLHLRHHHNSDFHPHNVTARSGHTLFDVRFRFNWLFLYFQHYPPSQKLLHLPRPQPPIQHRLPEPLKAEEAMGTPAVVVHSSFVPDARHNCKKSV